MRGKHSTRHLIFAGLFILIAIAMVSGIRLETRVSSETKRMFNYIENLPPESVLLVSFDHEASSLPEIRPIALALLRHAFERGHKVIGMALLAEGTAIGYRLLEQVAREYDAEYGKDYVYLGFKPQYIAAILSLGESMSSTFPLDYLDFPYDQHPILRKIERYDDVAAVLSIADGSLTTHWMEYAGSRYDVTVLGGVTAAMVTTYDPYLASGQMHAMIGGLRGAAEYESLLGREGGGGRGMLAQSTAHLYVILLIIIGNGVYYLTGRKRRR